MVDNNITGCLSSRKTGPVAAAAATPTQGSSYIIIVIYHCERCCPKSL